MSDRILRLDELTAEQRRLVLALIEANKSTQMAPTAKQGSTKVRHEVVRVTPEIASEWLARPSTRQRSIARMTVYQYGRAMSEGRWHQPSTDPIAFTDKGELLNGQHRLTSLVKVGVTLDMLVAYDVPEDLFDIIDTGRRRSASQFVRAPHATGLAAAARMILWYDHRRLADPRQRLTDASSAKHLRRSPSAVWMLTVRAFNAYMQGRPVKTLKYEPTDAPPAIDLTGKANSRESLARHRSATTQPRVIAEMAANGPA